MNRELPQRLHSVVTSDYANTNGIVAVRNGCIVREEYFHGFGLDVLVRVASVTKSVLSALTGIAADKGYIPSVRRKIMECFPDYASETHDRSCGNVAIENLLTMTIPYAFEEWKEPLEQLCTSPDWMGFTLDMMRGAGETDKPGRHFQHCTAGAHLLSAVLQRAVGMSTWEFANRYLFAPVGMTVIPDYPMETYTYDSPFGEGVRGWVYNPEGVTAGGWGLTMTPRDMARFGLPYLNMGMWNGAHIIPESWVRQSVKRTRSHHGYMWWQFEKKGVAIHAVVRDEGNMICWVLSRELVVAMTSGFAPDAKNRRLLVRGYILPAVEEIRVGGGPYDNQGRIYLLPRAGPGYDEGQEKVQHYLASPAGARPAVWFKAGCQGDNRKNATAFEGTGSVWNVDKTVHDTFPLKTEYFLTEKGKVVLKALEIYQKMGTDYMIETG